MFVFIYIFMFVCMFEINLLQKCFLNNKTICLFVYMFPVPLYCEYTALNI